MVLLGLIKGGCGGNTVKNINNNNSNHKEVEERKEEDKNGRDVQKDKQAPQMTAGNKFSWPRSYEKKKRPSSSSSSTSSADHLFSSAAGGGGGLVRLGKYELGRTLGEGNFGKVKYARNLESGQSFAVKILEKHRILDLNITHQIKREIGTLKLLKHPNVVRLHEVLASKSKIYMVLEYVDGGELFERIASKGKLSEAQGRRLFQQLIDGVSYCHNKGVFHRDLKLENVLVDARGNVKITDFGLSALPQHLRDDGLLHTTCGSPNYVAPEILSNRGYDGAAADTWSCGVILYVILTGHLPFDDRNLAVLYQKIFKGDAQIPKWLSPAAQNLIKRILDPNPRTRISMADIKVDDWFRKDYSPASPLPDDDDDDNQDNLQAYTHLDDDPALLSTRDSAALSEAETDPPESHTLINAFELIGMSSCLDLSGFFEKEDVSERKIRFASTYSPRELLDKIEEIATQLGFQVQKKNGKLKVMQESKGQKSSGSLSVTAEVFEISSSLHVVELRKSSGDPAVYRQLCEKLSNDLGASSSQECLTAEL